MEKDFNDFQNNYNFNNMQGGFQNGFDMIDLQKHIWEGWTVGDFVERLAPELDRIMSGRSWRRPFTTKQELATWCRENQPYYKKHIPGVVAYFAWRYRLR